MNLQQPSKRYPIQVKVETKQKGTIKKEFIQHKVS